MRVWKTQHLTLNFGSSINSQIPNTIWDDLIDTILQSAPVNSTWLFSCSFHINTFYALPVHPMLATRSDRAILLDLIIVTFHTAVASSLIGGNSPLRSLSAINLAVSLLNKIPKQCTDQALSFLYLYNNSRLYSFLRPSKGKLKKVDLHSLNIQ
jgi:hypothetical protein